MIDIRGVWKYQNLLEEYSQLQVRASKAMLTFKAERDEASRECEVVKERCEQQKKDLTALRLKCGALENECKQLRAEIKNLKKIRWRWLDNEHGWWPTECADLDDMVQKIPYVVYTPQKEEKRVPES